MADLRVDAFIVSPVALTGEQWATAIAAANESAVTLAINLLGKAFQYPNHKVVFAPVSPDGKQVHVDFEVPGDVRGTLSSEHMLPSLLLAGYTQGQIAGMAEWQVMQAALTAEAQAILGAGVTVHMTSEMYNTDKQAATAAARAYIANGWAVA